MDELKELNNKYFKVVKLADGVFALIGTKDAGSNGGIIDLGDYTVIFDSFLNIEAASKLREVAVKLTDKQPTYLINSHGHFDHIVGNIVFADCHIISSEPVRKKIAEQKIELEEGREEYQARLAELIELKEAENDSLQKATLENEFVFISNLIKEDVKIIPPKITFSNKLILTGSARSLELITYENGHYPGNLVGYLAEEKICFMGDLLFAQTHPWLGDGDLVRFKQIMKQMLREDVNIFIPGHGQVASKKALKLQLKYIEEIERLLKLKKDGQEIDIKDLSAEFSNWESKYIFNFNIDVLAGKKLS